MLLRRLGFHSEGQEDYRADFRFGRRFLFSSKNCWRQGGKKQGKKKGKAAAGEPDWEAFHCGTPGG
jgi:hypothetical protein